MNAINIFSDMEPCRFSLSVSRQEAGKMLGHSGDVYDAWQGSEKPLLTPFFSFFYVSYIIISLIMIFFNSFSLRCIFMRCCQTLFISTILDCSCCHSWISRFTQGSSGFTQTFCCSCCVGFFFIRNLHRLEICCGKVQRKTLKSPK